MKANINLYCTQRLSSHFTQNIVSSYQKEQVINVVCTYNHSLLPESHQMYKHTVGKMQSAVNPYIMITRFHKLLYDLT
jgi:hypothetical protein